MPCYNLLIQVDSLTSWCLSGHLCKIFFRRKSLEFAFAYFLQRKADVGTDYPTFYVAAIPSTAVSGSRLCEIKTAVYICSLTASLSTSVKSSPPYSLTSIATKTIKTNALICHSKTIFTTQPG